MEKKTGKRVRKKVKIKYYCKVNLLNKRWGWSISFSYWGHRGVAMMLLTLPFRCCWFQRITGACRSDHSFVTKKKRTNFLHSCAPCY